MPGSLVKFMKCLVESMTMSSTPKEVRTAPPLAAHAASAHAPSAHAPSAHAPSARARFAWPMLLIMLAVVAFFLAATSISVEPMLAIALNSQ